MEDVSCICMAPRRSALASTRLYDAAPTPSVLRVTIYRLLNRVAIIDGATITALGADRLAAARPLWNATRSRMRDRLGPRAETLPALLNGIDADGSAP